MTDSNHSNLDLNDAAPPTLNHVIGQERAVRQLRVALDAHYNDRAAARQGETVQAFPHVLLVGPPGVGKSLLSAIVAKELGGALHEELAQNIHAPNDLHGLMLLADEGDVVFVDEIHELIPPAQTALYRCLEERRLFLPSGRTSKRQSITLPPFTFVSATTDEWNLAKPLRDRFKLVLRLEHYGVDELMQVVANRARRMGWTLTDETAMAIAQRGRGTPRLALRLLDAARRSARAEDASNITMQHLCDALAIEGVDRLGLDPIEQRYLRMLADSGAAVRLNVLATRLGLPRQTIEQVIESDLLRLDLIAKGEAGRTLTVRGREHLQQPDDRSDIAAS
ncbi:Holliday junction DNA helicase RuvB C-terminal domain-containing protein [Phycisphaerales bacterium AB-hyl4]|uniref:Holliday junction DNA helicase RuvB C-terminal domain-containing protein n=1 Tax=Natronomicrosphaera hydrolytica TaxID=3242702 RepID=A0ABV4U757_9BACT